jgi:uncharacterized membrane protein
MIAGLVALIVASIFSGAALYVGVAEHPSRMRLGEAALLTEWKPAYKRGYAMQASLALIGFVLGALAWWQTERLFFLFGAIVLLANWPYTLIFMMPTNKALMAADPATAGAEARGLMERWGRLHMVRTVLGFAAVILFLWASVG